MSLVGGSQLVSIILGVVRLKVLAVLLGPAGIGLFGVYNVILDLAASCAGFGVQASGVRQVAIAGSTGDRIRVARTAQVLTRLSFLLALGGCTLLVVLAGPIANTTFGDWGHAPSVALLGLALLLRILAGAPTAIVQGSRRLGDLARMTILGAVLNTVVAVPLALVWGEAGIVPSLVAVALTSWLAAVWYSRKLQLDAVAVTWRETFVEARVLLNLGFAFMASGLLMSGAAYVIRLVIVQHSGVEAAGNYQAAWALGGVYVGFILQAMGTDFYPRLSALVDDEQASNRLVNEQARVGLLLAGPGLLITIALSPVVITLFYSTQFTEAVPILRWLCLGMLLRVMAWPMGYLVLAKGLQKTFFWTEVAATAVHVGLAYWLVGMLGATGAGIAFAGLYLWHGVVIFVVVKRLTHFAWSRQNLVLGLVFLGLTSLELAVVIFLPPGPSLVVGLAVTTLASWYSLTQLVQLMPQEWIPSSLRPLVYRLLRHRPATA